MVQREDDAMIHYKRHSFSSVLFYFVFFKWIGSVTYAPSKGKNSLNAYHKMLVRWC